MAKDKKILVLLAKGYEETEYVAVRDALIRDGNIVESVSMSDDKLTYANHNIQIMADYKLDEIINNLGHYDVLFIPGGQGVEVLDKMPEFDEIIDHFVVNNKIIGAICAAPSLLAKRGLLEGKKAVVYPSDEFIVSLVTNGVEYDKELDYVGDGNFFTGKNMQVSVAFGYAFGEYLK